MTFQLKGWDYTESVANLEDPDDLPLHYSQVMTAASLLYPAEVKRILMIGLGGGSISTYYGRAMPDVHIDTVELDQRVIDVAKQYFALRETPRVRYIAADGRVFLNRSKDRYDLILLDAYRGGYVPFHLLTREFYTLVKSRLTPGGAVAFNVHDGTKLYHSTVRTLGEVFPTVDLYPSGMGEVIATLSADPEIRPQRAGHPRRGAAGALQVPLPAARRAQAPHANPQREAQGRRHHHRRFRAGEPLRHHRRAQAEAEEVAARGTVVTPQPAAPPCARRPLRRPALEAVGEHEPDRQHDRRDQRPIPEPRHRDHHRRDDRGQHQRDDRPPPPTGYCR